MDIGTGMVIIVGLHKFGAPTADLVKDLMLRLLGPAADAGGRTLASSLQAWADERARRATKLVGDAAQVLQDAGIEPRAVPGRILWPILEKGSLEENEALQRRWVALLANAASHETFEVNPAFSRILAELTPLEARLLDKSFVIPDIHPGSSLSSIPFDLDAAPVPHDERGVILTHLNSLGLIREYERYRIDVNAIRRELARDTGDATEMPLMPVLTDRVDYFTPLGSAFVRACRLPPKR